MITLKILPIVSLAVLISGAFTMAFGQAAADTPAEDPFEAREYQGDNGGTLLYRLLQPADYAADGTEKHPLLIFLHGAGERGSDNKAQLKHGRSMMEDFAREQGCFIVAPQCPTGEKWVDVNWSAGEHRMPCEPSQSMCLLLQVLKKLQKEFRVDADRLYVMGLSMGGYGTWDLIQRCPGKFAAAVPICGGGDVQGAEAIAKTPVWAFHGDKDGAVPVTRTRDMIAAIKAAGGEPRYTEYPGVGHDSWTAAFADAEMRKWLFSQKRSCGK